MHGSPGAAFVHKPVSLCGSRARRLGCPRKGRGCMGKNQWIAVVLGAIGSVGTTANASLTAIEAPPSGEKNQAQILSHFYGGTFVSDRNDLTNGTLRAVRLDDSGGDSTFAGGPYSVETIAK